MKLLHFRIHVLNLLFLLLCSISAQSQEIPPSFECDQITSFKQFLSNKPPWIAIIGGCYPSEENYSQAQIAGYLLAKNGYAIMTGSGPGIMEAANRGALIAGGISLGIILPNEKLNEYIPLTNYYEVSSICHRLHIMIACSSGCIAFPGGLGTLNEVCFAVDQFQYIPHHPPIILVGEEFWKPLIQWLQNLYNYKFLKNLFLVDSSEEAVQIITSYYE
ncbi:LOG family protein [Chlamydia avium]|uniref:AMP nucleosidase n=1 Tax=Chlamydia avium 10DC88 TaxID=1229831 RepID=W8JGA6_9CHLA|nr:LOG family protein [Chlamydia avium]AHK63195.1 Putative lysine decarboxylase family protein [Chlamydia avium 10DC88]